MTTQGTFIPVDMQSLCKMNDEALGNIETAFRTWYEYSSRMQELTMNFMRGRLARDTAAVVDLGNCKSPVDAFNVQVAYITGTYADFVDESQKIALFLSDAANEAPATAAEQGAPSTSGKAKRALHRRSAHSH